MLIFIKKNKKKLNNYQCRCNNRSKDTKYVKLPY